MTKIFYGGVKMFLHESFEKEDLYVKLNEVLNYLGHVKREKFVKLWSFRIDKLKKGKDSLYLILDELNWEIYLVSGEVEKIWNESVAEVINKVEKHFNKEFMGFFYANTLILIEKDWWGVERDLLKLVKGFVYKETKEIDKMFVDVLERDGFLRVDVYAGYIITLFKKKLDKMADEAVNYTVATREI